MLSFLILNYFGCTGGPDVKIGTVNQPPSATILAPADGSSFNESTTIDFEAMISDSYDDPPDLNVVWSSDIDAELVGGAPASPDGTLIYSTANLSPGLHTISLTVYDSDEANTTSSISVEIIDLPEDPAIEILHPAGDDLAVEGENFNLVASAWDARGNLETLLVTMTSDLDGEICIINASEEGLAECEHTFSSGEHLLEFTVINEMGYDATASTYFDVTALVDVDNDEDGFTENQNDCDDADPSIYPGAPEVENGFDDNCDGTIDEGTDAYDDDGDGYTEHENDCNDGDFNVNPDAIEVEDGIDNNCNGVTDEGTNAYDDDGDGVSENDGDCNDVNANIYPGAVETENGTDDDCDGYTDEGTNAYDDDNDGVSENQGDCNDGNATIYPGAPEVENGTDDDCDGITDEGTNAYDDDGDGYTENAGDCNDGNPNVKPGVAEVCGDGIDNNCNSLYDEQNAQGCTTYYRDSDFDGYGDGGFSECWCNAGGSTGEYDVTNSQDCYDGNANARPGQTGYFTTSRGDGSYDYNCNNSEAKQYSVSGACNSAVESIWNLDCSVDTVGWDGGVPGCGSSAYYILDNDSCSWDGGLSCGEGGPSYTTRTQACN